MGYWGQGTLVTVSSGSPSPPSLFPLVSCENALADESLVAMGCLATDFLPEDIKFTWNFQNNTAISSQDTRKFSPVLREGKYAASSHVVLPSVDILQGTDQFLMCNVKHSNGDRKVQVVFSVPPELPPSVSVFVPPRDAFSGTNPRTSRLICQATGFSPKKISVSWLRDGKLLVSNFTTDKVEAENKGSHPTTYKVDSMLTITENDWASQSMFTCQVNHNGLTFRKNVSSMCNPGPSSIRIFAIPPSFSQTFITKKATLSCLVTDLTTTESLNISWTRENNEVLETDSTTESQPNATFSVKGQASICAEDWEKRDKFTCTVTHRDLPSPLRLTISKPEDVAKHKPSVYVLPPSKDELTLGESASVTCLVKLFSPPDVSVQWQQKGQPLSAHTYVTSSPVPEPQHPGLYFVHSILTTSADDWNAGDSYTCVVVHEALPLSITERTVDKFTDMEVTAEEDSFENLNTMASTFIVLFLLSLFYSTTVTLFKVK